jgi:1-acyl-sn-glycerol-3-phosphate acyltransferase
MNRSDVASLQGAAPAVRGRRVNPRWYHTARRIIGFILTLLLRIEVSGVENVPLEGAVILATNHLHWLDPPVLLTAISQREITVFAASKYKNRFFVGWFLSSMRGIFVRREEIDRQALKESLRVLAAGGMLGMAPEGSRSKTGGLQRAPAGLAYIAHKSGAPVLPVVVYGLGNAEAEWKRLRRPHVRAVIGEPFTLPPVQGAGKSRQLAANTEIVMHRLAALLPPRYRGVYG